jgi:hypothetical protein
MNRDGRDKFALGPAEGRTRVPGHETPCVHLDFGFVASRRPGMTDLLLMPAPRNDTIGGGRSVPQNDVLGA